MVIRFEELSPFAVIFTHEDPDTREQTTFVIGPLLKWIEETHPEVFTIPVDAQIADYYRKTRGIEQHRLTHLTRKIIKRSPVVFAEWEGNTQLLVDGSHRYVRADDLGMKIMPAYILPTEQWKPFVVDGMPKAPPGFSKGFSGIF